MSIADDVRDRRAPPSSRSATSKVEKARRTRIALIRRIAEARTRAAEVTAIDKSEGMAGVVRQLAQKETRR